MRTQAADHRIDRRSVLINGAAALAGAAALPVAARAQDIQLAQAGGGAGAAASPSAIAIKSVERLAGSAVNYAYAVKAGPWIFLNGHEAYDFEKGLAPEVEGPPGNRLAGRPPLRREADYILQRMGRILKEFGAELKHAVRVDQFYTMGPAVSAYHLARFAEFGQFIPPSTSIIMDRCFTARTNTHTSLLAVVPGPGVTVEGVRLPNQPISASGYFPAMVVNDVVFVAGNMALEGGTLPPSVKIPETARWGGQTGFRRQVHTVIKDRLEPSLKAAGSELQHSLKAQAYIRGTDNYPDFMDVWNQHFKDIPCAITVVPAKDYASSEGMVEINLIALKSGSTRRKAVVQVDLPGLAAQGPVVRAGDLVFASGLMPVGRDGRVSGAANGEAFDGLSLAGQQQGAALLEYAEAVCKTVGVTSRNIVRAQYFMTDMREFAGITTAWMDRFGKQPHPFAAVQVPGPLPPDGAVAVADFWIYAG